jgi:sugar lactone lactonase YvrE
MRKIHSFAVMLGLIGLVFPLLGAAQQANAWKVDDTWAGGQWDGSTSWIATDGKGKVVVLVRDAPYFREYTRDGEFIRSWGDDGLFSVAHSLTIDAEGNYWVTDSSAHVVKKLSSDGELLLTLGQAGLAGDNQSEDRFNQVNHVAIAANGDIYVSDGYVNARIVHFTPDGRYVRSIEGDGRGTMPGQITLPHGVALDASNRILVNDSDNARVSVFENDGRFVETWPYPSRGGIEVAADGTVYISDVNAGIVNIVDSNGKLLDSVNADRAHGLAIDTDGSIYTSGASRMTVMKITRQ